MLVAHLAQQREVIGGRHYDTAGALHRLGHHGGDRLWACVDDDLLQRLRIRGAR